MSEVEERRSFSSPRIPRRVTIAPVPLRDTTHPTQDYNPSPLSFSGSDDIETVNTNEIPIQKTQGNKRVNSRAVHFLELNPQDAWLPITESRMEKLTTLLSIHYVLELEFKPLCCLLASQTLGGKQIFGA